MDRIRDEAEQSARRLTGLGLLVIAVVIGALHSDRSLAMHALAVLLTLEVLTLFQLSRNTDRLAHRIRTGAVPLYLDDRQKDRHHRLRSEALRDTLRIQARRLCGPALAAWVVDMGLNWGLA